MQIITFGEYIRTLRERKGATLEDIANKLGYSKMYLSEIERDKKEPTNEIVRKVSELYKVDELLLYRFLNRINPIFEQEFREAYDVKDLVDIISQLSKLEDKGVAYAQIKSYAHGVLEKHQGS